MGKMTVINILETIEALSLKIGRRIQLNELMKSNEY